VQQEQKNGGYGNGRRDRPRGAAIEQGDAGSCKSDGDREEEQMAESEAGAGVGRVVGEEGRSFRVVFPGVDEEAVQAA